MQHMNDYYLIMLAMENYHDSFGNLPPHCSVNKDGQKLFSWRFLIVPYIQSDDLYAKTNTNLPWDSDENLLSRTNTYSCYTRNYHVKPKSTDTFIKVYVGTGTAFETPLSKEDFPDGVANTIFFSDARESICWTKPGDMSYLPDGPLPQLRPEWQAKSVFGDSQLYRVPYYIFAFGDCSVRLADDLRAMITRNGEEAFVEPDWSNQRKGRY